MQTPPPRAAALAVFAAALSISLPAYAQSVSSFAFSKSEVTADSNDVQRLTLTLADASSVDEVRYLLNRSGHSENERTNSGYLQITSSSCAELGAGLGNADLDLLEGSCEFVYNLDGSATIALEFVVEASFGSADNNHVSGLWYSGGTGLTGWKKLTSPGQGFRIAPSNQSTFQSFSAQKQSLPADANTVQTLSVTLNQGAQVDDLRLLINHPWHVENGRAQSGYFQWTPTSGCQELGAGLGNDIVALQTDDCTDTTAENGSRTWTFPFVLDPSHEVSINNQVSLLWLEGDEVRSSWRRVTAPGAGFRVTEPTPGTLHNFSLGSQSVQANGEDTQTLTLSLFEAEQIDEVRFLINYNQHTEDSNSPRGYFQWTESGGCAEINTLGSDLVELNPQQCTRTLLGDGVVQWSLPFAVLPSAGASTNNQVSAISYQDGANLTGWRRYTTPGQGFDITPPPAGSLRSFSLGKPEMRADGSDPQTLNLTLFDAASVDEVRFLINYNQHAEDGNSPRGYFQWTEDGGCTKIGGGLGNADVTLLADQCTRTLAADGSVTWSIPFVALSTQGESTNNQVSAIWYADGATLTGWRKLTSPGQGYNVVGGSLPPAFGSFEADPSSVAANGDDVLSLNLTLERAEEIDEIRILINHPWHVENNRAQSGYLQWTENGGCVELGTGLGNADIELLADQCTRTVHADRSVTFRFPLTAASSFGESANNQVSAIWYQDGANLSGWQKLTAPQQGFATVADSDGDGIEDTEDNCPNTPNPGQEDSNGNQVGDACESSGENLCGGTTGLSHQPGTPCGPGLLEQYVCQGTENVVCDFGEPYLQVSAGYDHTCAIRSNQTLECWGSNLTGQASPPSGTFLAVASGRNHTCGLKTDNTLTCWGDDANNQLFPPSGTFKAISTGEYHSCAIRTDDTVACWGLGFNGETMPPSGTFEKISAGPIHNCAIRSNQTLACWGSNNYGESNPPNGAFLEVSAGRLFSCGIRNDETLLCWGNNAQGILGFPAGNFQAVSGYDGYACAVNTNGDILCWGNNDFGQTDSPDGAYKDITTGLLHSCARRPDNTVACWGDEGWEGTQPPRGNACGGTNNLDREPGSACGQCGLDKYACNGTSETTCNGDTAGNLCGGCAELAAEPGTACGRCALDTYQCNGNDAVACDGNTPENVCGGCQNLPANPGDSCGQSLAVSCNGGEDTACTSDQNACGGNPTLALSPGDPCTYGGNAGFLACYEDLGVLCSTGFDPITGNLNDLTPPVILSGLAAGDVYSDDVNGDGISDVISGAYVTLGPLTPGTWTLSELQVISGFGRIEPVGDINGDGFRDFLLGNRDLIYGPANTNNDLRSPDASLQNFSSRAIGSGDANGDGYDDLVMQNDDGFHLFYGPLSGTLTASDADLLWIANDTNGAILADVTGADGIADLALERCDTLSNLSNGSTQAFVTILPGNPSQTRTFADGITIQATEPNSGSLDHGCPALLAAGDTNGDGNPDIALEHDNWRNAAQITGRILVVEGPVNAAINLGEPQDNLPSGVRAYAPPSPDAVRGSNVTYAVPDLDADGNDELLFKGFDLLYSLHGLHHSSIPRTLAGGDVNGDGLPDLILERTSDIEIIFGAPSAR